MVSVRLVPVYWNLLLHIWIKPQRNLWSIIGERLYAFVDDNLVGPLDGIKHCGEVPEQDNRSASMLNIAIVLWLRIIHHDLLSLVKRRFATELRGKTIFSIREEITESLQSLMHDLQ